MKYKVARAEIQGKIHKEQGTPCQDKTAYIIGNDFACVALADGAGSRAHSEIGAQITVNATCCYFKNLRDIESIDEKDFLRFIIDNLIGSNYSFYDLASTLLFVFIKNRKAIIGHLGDGMIFGTDKNNTEVLSYPENGEEKNITFFTTDNDAYNHLRVKYVDIPNNYTFLLTSDGGGDCLYSNKDKAPSNAVKIFSEWIQRNDEADVNQAIDYNLSNVGPKLTHDDISVIELNICESD